MGSRMAIIDRAIIAAARISFVAVITAGFAAFVLSAYVDELRS
jgi:hypothetical protein